MKNTTQKGYTLIELVVAVGLFALIMMLVSGAYLMMIALTRHAQGTASGIDNLSFALESMTRTIRTGVNYNNDVDCPLGCASFSVVNATGIPVSYTTSGGVITQSKNGQAGVALTDPSLVTISSLLFYVSGTKPFSANDSTQPHVTIIISGTVSSERGTTQSFTIETGATMRGTDL